MSPNFSHAHCVFAGLTQLPSGCVAFVILLQVRADTLHLKKKKLRSLRLKDLSVVVELKLFNNMSVAAILCSRNGGADGKSTKEFLAVPM